MTENAGTANMDEAAMASASLNTHERTFVIMKICTCEACKYTFRYPLIPPRCPDCGCGAVREADMNEIKEYHRLQEILAEEIRLGIYGAAAAG